MDESPIQHPFDEEPASETEPSSYQSGMVPLEEETSTRSFVLLMLGVATLGCVLLLAGGLYFYQPQVQNMYDQYFPSPTTTATRTPIPTATITPTPTNTPTATVSPTPHVLLTPPQGETVFTETFANNDNDWYPYYANSTVKVQDGKLVFRATTKDIIGVAFCTSCPIFHDSYYFQAELYTVKKTPEEYGLAFCASGYGSNYYVFYIDPQDKNFGLYRHTGDAWEEIIYEQSSTVHSHPVSNTLGVLYQQGESKLYINNTLVFTYQDNKPFSCRKAGFIVNNGLVDVSVDNVFGYNIQTPP